MERLLQFRCKQKKVLEKVWQKGSLWLMHIKKLDAVKLVLLNSEFFSETIAVRFREITMHRHWRVDT